jgi:hypothetical protein
LQALTLLPPPIIEDEEETADANNIENSLEDVTTKSTTGNETTMTDEYILASSDEYMQNKYTEFPVAKPLLEAIQPAACYTPLIDN